MKVNLTIKRKFQRTLLTPAVLGTIGAIFWIATTVCFWILYKEPTSWWGNKDKGFNLNSIYIAAIGVMCGLIAFIFLLICFFKSLFRRYNPFGNWVSITFSVIIILIIISVALIVIAAIHIYHQYVSTDWSDLNDEASVINKIEDILKGISGHLLASSILNLVGSIFSIVAIVSCYISVHKTKKRK